MQPTQAYLSGQVRRFHTHPVMARHGQTTAEHQWGATVLLLMLNPDASAALIRRTLTHDVGELVAGDLGAPFKRANPEYAAKHAAMEEIERTRILGLEFDAKITDREKLWLVLVDRLEAILFVALREPRLLNKPEWQEDIAKVGQMAISLGCREGVSRLLDEIAKQIGE